MSTSASTGSNTASPGGIGFGGALTITFIVLKLTGVITWSWWWVLAPTWIPAAFVLLILLIILGLFLIKSA